MTAAFCPAGDPYCPCRDGDACHYIAFGTSPAIPPPTRTQIDQQVENVQAWAGKSAWHAAEAARVFQHREDWLESITDPRDPHPTRTGLFRDHNCWKCRSGELPCVAKVMGNCGYLVARNC